MFWLIAPCALSFSASGLPIAFAAVDGQTDRAVHTPKTSGGGQADPWLAKLAGHAQCGEVDLLIDQAVYHWKPKHKDAAWKIIGEFAAKLIKWEQQVHQRAKLKKMLANNELIAKPDVNLGGLMVWDPVEIADAELTWTKWSKPPGPHMCLVRAGKFINQYALTQGIYVTGESIDASASPQPGFSVLLSNDSVSLSGESGAPLVVICDGTFKGTTRDSIVIAREGVEYWTLGSSLILSGGPVQPVVRPGTIGHSTVMSSGAIFVSEKSKLLKNVIKENEPNPLGPVRFFDPAQYGIEVGNINNNVGITKLAVGEHFAKAGLKVGDVVVKINKSPVISIAGFRKVLRRHLAGMEALQFEVRRNDEVLSISVANKFPEKN
jgi:hypothetical protein